jgi:putative ABC transport system substrate-binding protein
MLLAFGFSVEAEQSDKVHRIVILRSGSPSPSRAAPGHEELLQGLRDLGYVEGKNIYIDYRYANSKTGRASEVAEELARLKVDVIVTSPAPQAVRAAQRATRTIPIVMTGTTLDPIKAGFAVSLARPGGNITGLVSLSLQLTGKRLEILKELYPQISSVAIVVPPQAFFNDDLRKERKKELAAVGKALGIQSVAIVHSEDIDSMFSIISQERHDALLVPSSAFTIAHRARIIKFAAKRRLPSIYSRREFVEAGGLISYAADQTDIFRRAASYVDKILKGTKPADLPIEQPTKFELVINLKTAKSLGLKIPGHLLMAADKVIE